MALEPLKSRKPQPELLKCADMAMTLAAAIENVTLVIPPNAHHEMVADLTDQLKRTAKEAAQIAKRLRRMQVVSDNSDKANNFLIVDGDIIRPATPDEVLRQVMHYPPKGTSIFTLVNAGQETIKKVFREE